jgi:transcriptional regulator with XRE-family HTH domain
VSDLSDVIKAIRKRQGMSMDHFAKLLGVTHGQVSRYESGQAVPGSIPLGRLLNLSEGVEKNPILERLGDLLGYENRRITPAEAIRELERLNYYPQPLWNSLPPPPTPPHTGIWHEFSDLWPNLAESLKAMDELCARRREVDPSLAQFMRLWLTNNDMDPNVRQCFSDAVRYLEFLLATKVQPHSSSTVVETATDAGPRSSYRVTLPIDLGDGVMHQPGELIDLDLATAKLYSHALIRVEPVRRSKKKSA